MQITSRFTVAVHTLVCIYVFSPKHKITSDFIASSVDTNPVVIRRIMSDLRRAGLISVVRGAGGTQLAKGIDKITLFDVYQAVDSVDGDLFHFHENPNPLCPVGKNIHRMLDKRLNDAQQALEESLRSVCISDLEEINGLREI